MQLLSQSQLAFRRNQKTDCNVLSIPCICKESTHRKGNPEKTILKKGKVEEYICFISNLQSSMPRQCSSRMRYQWNRIESTEIIHTLWPLIFKNSVELVE